MAEHWEVFDPHARPRQVTDIYDHYLASCFAVYYYPAVLYKEERRAQHKKIVKATTVLEIQHDKVVRWLKNRQYL